MKRKTAPMFKKEVFFFSFSYLSYTPVPTGFRGLDDLVDNVTNCETFCSESETLHGKKSQDGAATDLPRMAIEENIIDDKGEFAMQIFL